MPLWSCERTSVRIHRCCHRHRRNATPPLGADVHEFSIRHGDIGHTRTGDEEPVRHPRKVAMTGFEGGELKDLADVHLNVPNTCFGQIEDAHMIIEHAIIELLKEALGGESSAETC